MPRLISNLTLDLRLQSRHHMTNMIKCNKNRPVNSYLFNDTMNINGEHDLWNDRYLCIFPYEIKKHEYFYYIKTQRLTGVCFYNKPSPDVQKIYLSNSLRIYINLSTQKWHYYPMLDFRCQEITDRFNKLIRSGKIYDKDNILPYESELIGYI